ncbi:MAG: hypothetical protein RLZZ144_735, partial [Pseudomonadota bacterium]
VSAMNTFSKLLGIAIISAGFITSPALAADLPSTAPTTNATQVQKNDVSQNELLKNSTENSTLAKQPSNSSHYGQGYFSRTEAQSAAANLRMNNTTHRR